MIVSRAQNDNLLHQVGPVNPAIAYGAKASYDADLDAKPKLTGEVALFETDEYGFVNSWSSKAEQVYGYEFDEIIGNHVSSLYAINELIEGKPVLDLLAVKSTGRHFTFGWQKRKNGHEFWTHSECELLTDKTGKLRGFRKFVVETAAITH